MPQRSILFILNGDPRTSPRPAEGLRIAAGIIAGKRVTVGVLLKDAATLILGELTEDLIDEDHFIDYRPVLIESGTPIFVRHGSGLPSGRGAAVLPHREVTDRDLATIAASADSVISFH